MDSFELYGYMIEKASTGISGLVTVGLFNTCHNTVLCVFSQEVRSELEQEAGQLKSFCNLGTELSQSKAFNNTQSLLDNVKGVSDEFTQLEANVNER